MAFFPKENMRSYQPKVALIHDDMVQSGGAEKLFKTISEIYPKAPIFTSLVDFSKTNISNERLRTSFIQKIPFARKLYKTLLPLYPIAFESFNFDKYDVVISSTARFAKAIITKPKTIHICYINSAPRFLWDKDEQKEYMPWLLKILTKPLFIWLKRWDLVAASRPDYFISNSKNIAKTVRKIYGRESKVVYPYVDTDYFHPAKVRPQDYLLIVSRLVKWKKIEIAIQAVNKTGRKLVIVGSGPDRKRLEKIAGQNSEIFFAGSVTNNQLRLYLQFAKALIITQKEDFGISTIESLACGRPVIAYRDGGQAEIIENKKSGIFFNNQSAQSIKDAIEAASKVKWDSSVIRKTALKYSKEVFISTFQKTIANYASEP